VLQVTDSGSHGSGILLKLFHLYIGMPGIERKRLHNEEKLRGEWIR